MLILDSNTISYYLRGDTKVAPRLQAMRPSDLGVPAIVEYELRYGLLRLPQAAAAPRLAALEQLLRPMQPFRPRSPYPCRTGSRWQTHRTARHADSGDGLAPSGHAGDAQCP